MTTPAALSKHEVEILRSIRGHKSFEADNPERSFIHAVEIILASSVPGNRATTVIMGMVGKRLITTDYFPHHSALVSLTQAGVDSLAAAEVKISALAEQMARKAPEGMEYALVPASKTLPDLSPASEVLGNVLKEVAVKYVCPVSQLCIESAGTELLVWHSHKAMAASEVPMATICLRPVQPKVRVFR